MTLTPRRAGACCALAVLLASGAAAAADPIGMVKTSAGTAAIVRGAQRLPVAVGTTVEQNDAIETASDGAIGVTFKDNSTISVGPDTQLVLDEFVFAPEEERYGFQTRMLQGTLMVVSGTIAKLAPEKVGVVTPVGTIGIRGTRFLVKVDAADRR